MPELDPWVVRETRESLAFHLRDYQENLKFAYLYRLTEVVVSRLSQAVAEQVEAYSADFATLADRVSTRQVDKERAAAVTWMVTTERMRPS